MNKTEQVFDIKVGDYMPFGFDPIEAEQKLKNSIPEPERIFLDVTILHRKTGDIIPLSFKWTNGKVYSVGEILEVRKGNSLKAFAKGYRYLCQKDKRKYYLFYDGESWYIEKAKPSY